MQAHCWICLVLYTSSFWWSYSNKVNWVQNLRLYFVFTTLWLFSNSSLVACCLTTRSDSRAIIDNSYDDVTLVVTIGTQCCCKAEWRLCLLWTDCCHVCGLNDRPAFILMPHSDDRWPRKGSSLPRLVSSPRPETCGKITAHNVVMSLYICMVCKGTIFALSVGIIFVRSPELAVSAEQCVHWEAGPWKAKIGAISRLTGSSLCGFWNSSPVCSLSLLSVEIHGALCVQGYTGEGNTFFPPLNSSRVSK